MFVIAGDSGSFTTIIIFVGILAVCIVAGYFGGKRLNKKKKAELKKESNEEVENTVEKEDIESLKKNDELEEALLKKEMERMNSDETYAPVFAETSEAISQNNVNNQNYVDMGNVDNNEVPNFGQLTKENVNLSNDSASNFSFPSSNMGNGFEDNINNTF